MQRIAAFPSLIENYLAETEFPDQPARLYQPIVYSLEEGGKRLRPMFVMLACHLFSDVAERALPAAAALEVFHNFTLLHDDIMDNAPLRRGRPSVYRKWNRNVAILSGDAMMIHAYRLLGRVPEEKLPEILHCFNEVAIRVCEGQQYDMDFESAERVSIDEYLRMIELKTSALFVGSVLIGAMIGGADAQALHHLDRFAREFGLAFQLQDDLLDSYGDSRLGKTVGGDILEGKKTFLMIRALELASESDRRMLRTVPRERSLSSAEKIAAVLGIYDRYGVKELTEREINLHFDRALAELDSLKEDPARVAPLKQFAQGLLGRTK